MRRSLFVLACLALATAAGAAAKKDLRGVRGPNTLKGRYYLGTVKGKARIGKNDVRCDWLFERTAKGALIRLDTAGEGKHSGWYLSYDPAGKTRGVFLTAKPGAGSYWEVTHDREGGVASFPHVIRAAGGKLKGYYLDAGAEAEKRTDSRGDASRAREAVLVEKPKATPRYDTFEISP